MAQINERISVVPKMIERRFKIEQETVRHKSETAAKIRDLAARQTLIEERLDLMIDKALRRLAGLKAFKELTVAQDAKRLPHNKQVPAR